MSGGGVRPTPVGRRERRAGLSPVFAPATSCGVSVAADVAASRDGEVGRVILVSSRLPASVHLDGRRVQVERSVGGVATGLAALHDPSRDVWIGWPGLALSEDAPEREEISRRLGDLGCKAVHLAPPEARGFYEKLANGTLWPLLHSFVDRLPVVIEGWDHYVRANRRFANAVVAVHEPGDVIWVHDYQLALVPGMVRRELPDARIGFFLHIPVPSPGTFRIFPWREDYLRGILGADLVGFHTEEYRANFAAVVRDLLPAGADPALDGFQARGGRFGVYPMGVDAQAWEARAASPRALAVARALKGEARGRKILAGVDRLDYTKGILRRLKALELAFAEGIVDPAKVLAVQLFVPSRQKIAAYGRKRSEVEELAGRINGLFGGLGAAPLRTMFGTISPAELAGLYSVADLMLVTPLRDGMNLVAKEFVATRRDEDGVLVLSEFAGAAAELAEAVLVNPYDTRGMAVAIAGALRMSADERRARMRSMRLRVRRANVGVWSRRFLEDLVDGLGFAPVPRRAPWSQVG